MADEKPDYASDVAKYVSTVDQGAVSGIVKHLGIALQSKDASLVAASDPEELSRIREGYMKKKLALQDSDDALDAALNDVMATMKGAREKSRVTVYYLLAQKYGKLDLFAPKS